MGKGQICKDRMMSGTGVHDVKPERIIKSLKIDISL